MEVGPISPGAWGKLLDQLTGAGVLAALIGLIRLYQNRMRPAADTRLVDAQAAAQHATADTLREESAVKVAREVNELFGTMMVGYRATLERNRELELENRRLKAKEVEWQGAIEYADNLKKLEDGPGEG